MTEKRSAFIRAATAGQNEVNAQERVAIVGFGGVADELAERIAAAYEHVVRIENDDFLDELLSEPTIVIDVGDGVADRGEVVAELDSSLAAQSIFFVDAYATDLGACARRLRHPERVVGYGLLGSLEAQHAVEIVDSEAVADDALELAQEFFAALDKSFVLVDDTPGTLSGAHHWLDCQ